MGTKGSRHDRRRWARRCTVSCLLGALLLSGAVADARAQRRDPVVTAPLPIGPPSETPVDRTERPALESLAPRADDGDRGLLGAPVFVPPGTVPYYAAPQYPAAPTYTGPAYYGPGYAGTPGTTTGPPRCLQYAPAYDEAGRFLASVCVR